MELLRTGRCPDSKCKKQLIFQAELNAVIECSNCGQRHEQKHLHNVEPISNVNQAFEEWLQKLLIDCVPEHVKKTSDFVKVRGLSNYGCKLISPLLTKYGLHKESQEIRLLRDMGEGEIFNCSRLANRAFLIEEENLLIPGYGKDMASAYLTDTLREIAKVNDGNEECLIPIHADGDGHCLLHAVSRALIGHELFWHPLMTNMKSHFLQRQSSYEELFRDFIEISEWKDIIDECDPNYVPTYTGTHGLRNIHIFGLANVLHRPIILIDSLEGMKSKGDYSAVFLPGLVTTEECTNQRGELHKPIIISWSSKGRNHFIPLVGVRGKALPRFPYDLLPKVWGLPQELLSGYMKFEPNNSCIIGGDNVLKESYLIKLTTAMQKHFYSLNHVSPSVVTDVYHHIFRPSGVVGMSPELMTEASQLMVKEERLFKCLLCQSVIEEKLPCPLNWLTPGGELYDIAAQEYGSLKDGYKYNFPTHDITCIYDKGKDKLLLVKEIGSLQCQHCKGSMRTLRADGFIDYINGDQLSKPASSTSVCGCGYKHYWDGKEYDNLPLKIPIVFKWNDIEFDDFVYWFQNEADPNLNSNVFQVAQDLVQKYIPGEFGSDRLTRHVVDQIMDFTSRKMSPGASLQSLADDMPNVTPCCVPTKFVLADNEKTTPVSKEESMSSKDPIDEEMTPYVATQSKKTSSEDMSIEPEEMAPPKKIDYGGAVVKQKRLSSSPISPKHPIDKGVTPPVVDIEMSPTQEKIKKSSVKKIRIACQDQENKMFTLTDKTTFTDIQQFIQDNFNLEKDIAELKYGFPMKTLQPEIDSHGEQIPLTCLKHGDRITVLRRKASTNKDEPMTSTRHRTKDSKPTTGDSSTSPLSSDIQGALTEDLDLWEWSCTERPLFQTNGIFYKMAFRDWGLLYDDQHFFLSCFPGKIFVYNERSDEILLCLGKDHITVKPLTVREERVASLEARLEEHKISSPPGIQDVRKKMASNAAWNRPVIQDVRKREYSTAQAANQEPRQIVHSLPSSTSHNNRQSSSKTTSSRVSNKSGKASNYFPGVGHSMRDDSGRDNKPSHVANDNDDIPTIRETIDFANFKIEKQYDRDTSMEVDPSSSTKEKESS